MNLQFELIMNAFIKSYTRFCKMICCICKVYQIKVEQRAKNLLIFIMFIMGLFYVIILKNANKLLGDHNKMSLILSFTAFFLAIHIALVTIATSNTPLNIVREIYLTN